MKKVLAAVLMGIVAFAFVANVAFQFNRISDDLGAMAEHDIQVHNEIIASH